MVSLPINFGASEKLPLSPGLPVVIDADGLEVAMKWPEALKGMDRTLLTPNANEFRRLCTATGIEGDGHSQLVKLCSLENGWVCNAWF